MSALAANGYHPAARSVARPVDDDPWAYARERARDLTHGVITIAVESGAVVQVDCTEKKRFKSRN